MMLKAFGAVAISALFAGAALAQDLVPYGEAGGFAVMVDPTLGNGCFLTSDFEDGSTVRIGLDPTVEKGYVATFNEAWGDIVDGQEYPVTFMLDDQQYDGTATGIHLSDVPGALIYFDSADFLNDLGTRSTLSLSANGEEVMVIDLTGTDEALAMTLACQAEQG
jgi:hypothetical protein